MPRVPTISPATGKPLPSYYVHTASANFVDVHGRTLLLRGVNLSGSSKTPVGCQTQVLDGFWEDAERGDKDFIGRPLDLDDGSADIHLARLKGWGFNMLRYAVTWEALEHEGPGKYDYEFMDYTVRVLRKCKEYGFKVFIDPHQDIWSRFSGGSGAPYWTLLACGINPRNFTATQAAIVHCEYPIAQDPDPISIPAMLWSTNYGRLAAQTLFTLFFSGRDFAPKCIIDGVNIQDYLEDHYFTAFGHLADRIQDAGDLLDSCVIGWDSLNEPFEGFCGNPDLANIETTHNASLKKGTHPTVLQSLRLGMGMKQTVENWKFGMFGPQRDGSVTIDPKGRKMWLDPDVEVDGVNARWGWKRDPRWKLGTCIWAQHGVWDVDTAEFLNSTYFATLPTGPDRPVVFIEDYWKAHWQKYVARIRVSHPEAIHFVQPPVFVTPPPLDEADLRGRACYSGHYYDGLTLVTRHWNWFNADALGLLRGKYKYKLQAVKIGTSAIRASLQEQLAMLKCDTKVLGAYPTLIGEIGTPFDMDEKRSYGDTDDGRYRGDYSSQQNALDASLNAADGSNCVNWTIWTYCPDNSHRWGDGWNAEDLSLWSADDLQRWKSYTTMTATSSTHTLLGKNIQSAVAHAAHSASTLSLATLGQTNSNEALDRKYEMASLCSWDNPLEFLTDGARAVGALSRPYPIATVGVPIDIQFDIKSTKFKLTVRVKPEDRPTGSSSEEGATSRDVLPTEIFVPVVHYASQSLVSRAVERTANLEAKYEDQQLSGNFKPTSETSTSQLDATQSCFDLDVQVSDGHWDVEGAMLKWWYDVPAKGEVEYTITIRRRGGSINSYEQAESCFGEVLCPTACRLQ